VTRPIVFLTDYGLADEFVGVCRGVIQRVAPGATVVDLTHQIDRQAVLHGAIVLGRAARFMPQDAVYLAVVDPGVGSERRPVAIEAASGALLVGPDNGLLSMAWEALGGAARAVEIASEEIVLHPVSRTFHGRDVFAPAAAHLAAGVPIERLGPWVETAALHTLEVSGPMVTPGAIGARVVGIDGFGNVQLNATPEDLRAAELRGPVAVGAHQVPVVATFTDVPEGEPALIVDSQGYLALVVNRGHAARLFDVRPGDAVTVARGATA
jgi:S-adenosyl-L-methionine hydrolase (adenosine-forming)